MFGEILSILGGPVLSLRLRDASELKSTGDYTEETEEKGDIIIKRVHWKSFDGSSEIHREYSTTKQGEKLSELYDLRRQIGAAVREMRFEDAIPLREQYKKLKEEVGPLPYSVDTVRGTIGSSKPTKRRRSK